MATHSQRLVIKAGSANKQYWRDVCRYRDLLYFLAWRDILVRYKQTGFGMAWALLRPFITMIVFKVVFGQLAKLPSEGAPHPILVFAAMLPWPLFANALQECSNSLVYDSNLMSQVYFPRLLVPFGSVMVSFVDCLLPGCVLLALMVWYSLTPSWNILLLPVFVLITVLTALGGGRWFAALNVKYRDFRFIVPFVVQLGLYVSPVGFIRSVVPEKWRLLYSFNPMVGIIDGFRWSILGSEAQIYWSRFLVSMTFVALMLFPGVRYFRRTERVFADAM